LTDIEFENLIKKYERLVFTVSFKIVNNYDEAQNIVQETFISAYKNINSCNPQKYKQWLCKIAVNRAKDCVTSAYARHTVLVDDNTDLDFKKTTNFQPEEDYISNEGAKEIKQIILNLKEPYKKVSVKHFIEEKSAAEIAQELERPKKTVQTQILRAKNIIRGKIKEAEKSGFF
jgi:RNA polymerase sigma-70 factor (ECF subfamily)